MQRVRESKLNVGEQWSPTWVLAIGGDSFAAQKRLDGRIAANAATAGVAEES